MVAKGAVVVVVAVVDVVAVVEWRDVLAWRDVLEWRDGAGVVLTSEARFLLRDPGRATVAR